MNIYKALSFTLAAISLKDVIDSRPIVLEAPPDFVFATLKYLEEEGLNSSEDDVPDFVFATLKWMEEEQAMCRNRATEDSEQTKSDRS